MRKLFFLVFCLIFSLFSRGQSSSDALAHLTDRAEFFFQEKDSLEIYANRLKQYSKKANSQKAEGLSLKYFAQAAFLQRDFTQAQKKAIQSQVIFKALGEQEELGDCCRILGKVTLLQEHFDLAYENFMQAKQHYKLAGKLSRPDSDFFVRNDFAYLYILTEKYEKALNILSEIQKQSKSDEVLAVTYSLYSILANNNGDYTESIKYFRLCKAIYEKLGRKTAALICDMNIAINYYYLKNYDASIPELRAVLKRCAHIKEHYPMRLRINLFLSNCYFEKNQLTIAKQYFNTVEVMLKEQGHEPDPAFKDIYLETKSLFLIKEKQYDAAEAILRNFVKINPHVSDDSRVHFYKQLESIAGLKKDPRLQKVYNDSVVQLEAKLKQEKQNNTMDLMKAEFKFNTIEKELELKNKEFELLKVKEKNQLIVLTAVVGFGVVCLLFFILLYSRQQKINSMRETMLVQEKQFLESVNRQKALEIDFKNKEIVDFALHVSEKNEILSEIKTRLKELPSKDSASQGKVNDLLFFINSTIHQDSEKVALYSEAQEVKDSFLQKLQALFPDLTEKETRVASLVRMQFTSKQIGEQLNITSASVDNYRSVLRRKMKIDKEQTLPDFLKALA